jgi:phytoene synthase
VSRDTNFYYSFLVLPRFKRRAIIAVWDFCRAVDDTVDLSIFKDASCVEATLEGWRSELDRCFGKETAQTAQGMALKPFIKRFDLFREPFDDLIDGVAMDLSVRRYETFDELHEYCLRVASAVGLICIEIFDYKDPRARDYARALGVALQLTNIIRDMPTDLSSGRLYFPVEDLRRFKCTEEDLRVGFSEPVRNLIEFECERAKSLYVKAEELLPSVDARRLVAAEIMSAIYQAILKRIEWRGYDVFSETVRVPRSRRALIAIKIWTRIMLRSFVYSSPPGS